jgi:hypothetical protein
MQATAKRMSQIDGLLCGSTSVLGEISGVAADSDGASVAERVTVMVPVMGWLSAETTR